MEKQLKSGKDISNMRKKLYSEFKKLSEKRARADEVHKEIVKLSEESESNHKELSVLFDKIKELRSAVEPATSELKKIKKDANEAHAAYIGIVGAEKITAKKVKDKKIKDEKIARELTEKELKKKAETLFDEFLKGKKLNSDELVIMQKYGPRD
ncbi:MAG: hypothetical protein KAT91_00825, partial [Candidatus Aenigmarchaeota archaeon]|nr:hypothetical protein [Candidatus Aenigmarchaeota archaeon]